LSSVPSPSLNHKSSYPSSSTFHPRKAESKLRNVLHTIDESQSKSDDLNDSPMSDTQSMPPPDTGSPPRSTHKYSPDTTPRHSALYQLPPEQEPDGSTTSLFPSVYALEEPPDEDARIDHSQSHNEVPQILIPT
jgi:hypothetical protein